MKTMRTRVYQFEELSNVAKHTAIKEIKQTGVALYEHSILKFISDNKIEFTKSGKIFNK